MQSIQNLTKEKETLEAQVKEANEAKDVLKAELDKKADYEKKYTQILTKARQLQLEKSKLMKQIQDQKANAPAIATANAESSASNSQESAAKIAELEKTLATVRKELSDKNIELTRLRAQYSMSQGKTNRLQKELDALKVAAAAAAEAAAASAATPQDTTTIAKDVEEAVATPIAEEAQVEPEAVPTAEATPKAEPASITIAEATPTPEVTSSATENDIEPIITTPAPVDTEITEAETVTVETTTVSQETATPEADLLMETEPAKQAEEEVAAASEEFAVAEEVPTTEEAEHIAADEETPVEVEVHELETEKVESPIAAASSTVEEDVAVDSPVVFNEEETATEEAVDAELGEVAAGVKRDREDENDAEVSGTQSPTKKLHTNV
jgi:hypothetical protein